MLDAMCSGRKRMVAQRTNGLLFKYAQLVVYYSDYIQQHGSCMFRIQPTPAGLVASRVSALASVSRRLGYL